MNTVTLIDQTLLSECKNAITQEVYDSVLVLHLLTLYFGICVTGIHSCVLDVLYNRDYLVSKSVKSSSLSFEYALVESTQAVTAVVLPSSESIKHLLNSNINITIAVNTAVKDILGLFDGVDITVGDIIKNVVKGDKCRVAGAKAQTRIVNALV